MAAEKPSGKIRTVVVYCMYAKKTGVPGTYVPGTVPYPVVLQYTVQKDYSRPKVE